MTRGHRKMKAIIVYSRGDFELKSDPMDVDAAARKLAVLKENMHDTDGARLEVRPICERCNLNPVEVETTDDQSLCMNCAQNSHVPCSGCSHTVPSDEVDREGVCLTCRVGDSDRHDPGNEIRRGLFEAERIILVLIRDDPSARLFRETLQLGLALKGVQNAHFSG